MPTVTTTITNTAGDAVTTTTTTTVTTEVIATPAAAPVAAIQPKGSSASQSTGPALPGKLGNPAMQLGEDPRFAPTAAAAFAALGMDKDAKPTEIPSSSTHDEIQSIYTTMEAQYAGLFEMLCAALPPIGTELEECTETITGVDGNAIKLYITRPVGTEGTPLPCFYHIHGGGMAMLQAKDAGYVRYRGQLAATGSVVIGVEFRNSTGALGPHPFPAGLNDCYSGLEWTSANKSKLGITSIVVTGESGGGNLTLATTMKAKQAGTLNMIDGVYAQCPYIAGPTKYTARSHLSMKENNGYFLDCDDMANVGRLYLDGTAFEESNMLAWPSYATVDDLCGLPPHCISVNELDPLRDEGLEHYRKLAAAGVSVYARTVIGTVHAADCAFPGVFPEAAAATIRDLKGFSDRVSGGS